MMARSTRGEDARVCACVTRGVRAMHVTRVKRGVTDCYRHRQRHTPRALSSERALQRQWSLARSLDRAREEW